jgi:hypothetical protein
MKLNAKEKELISKGLTALCDNCYQVKWLFPEDSPEWNAISAKNDELHNLKMKIIKTKVSA